MDDIWDCLLKELGSGRRFQVATSSTVFPVIKTEKELAILGKHLHADDIQQLTFCTISSRGFTARDTIPVKAIDSEWRCAVENLTGSYSLDEISTAKRKELLQQFMNGFSDKKGREAFPGRCFPPSFTPFSMEIHTHRCQTKEEYELFRESGIIKDAESSKLFSGYRLITIHISIPRSWFHSESKAFPLQNVWIDRLQELCGIYRTSVGSVKADIMYCFLRDHPLYTYQHTFKIGFRSRIGDLGWAMCMSKEQTDLLGGMEKLYSDAGFDIVKLAPKEHVYAQLTKDLTMIPRKKLSMQWTAMEPFLMTSDCEPHSILDIPISLCLGIQAQHIELTDGGLYSVTVR